MLDLARNQKRKIGPAEVHSHHKRSKSSLEKSAGPQGVVDPAGDDDEIAISTTTPIECVHSQVEAEQGELKAAEKSTIIEC